MAYRYDRLSVPVWAAQIAVRSRGLVKFPPYLVQGLRLVHTVDDSVVGRVGKEPHIEALVVSTLTGRTKFTAGRLRVDSADPISRTRAANSGRCRI